MPSRRIRAWLRLDTVRSDRQGYRRARVDRQADGLVAAGGAQADRSHASPSTLDWQQWLGPAMERPYNSAYLPFVWRGWWDFGTGAIGDMACHLMDPVFWALKLTYPIAVEAQSEGATTDSPPLWSIIHYDFPKRGDLPPVRVTWYDGGKRYPEDLLEGKTVPKIDNGSLFIGDQGKLIVDHRSRAYSAAESEVRKL